MARVQPMPAMKDLTGQRFGRLVVLKRAERRPRVHWECLCDCGQTTAAQTSALRSGNTRSCGCLSVEMSGSTKFVDLTGQRFGRLVVVQKTPDKGKGSMWECLCDCGEKIVTSCSKLRSGHTRSCGCLSRDVARARGVDLTGRTFGRWTVVARAPNSSDGRMYHCRCSCGTERIVLGEYFSSGNSTSCGCRKREVASVCRTVDRTGERFGRLTVLGRCGSRNNRSLWDCQCDCGNRIQLTMNAMRTGNTRSCGCLAHDVATTRNTRHGATRGRKASPEYVVWAAMIQRCTNPKEGRWDCYGGRGITVCERWRTSFVAFLADMGPRPSRRHQIDRINNDGNYEPGNCRWALPHEQQRNKRTNLVLEYQGRRMALAAWAEELGVDQKVLHSRLYNGWSVERAFTHPYRRSAKHPDRAPVHYHLKKSA